MKKVLPFVFIFVVTVLFFWQLIFKGLLPIPADTIIGLYHPFRDFYAKNYPRGIPFKNFLITDPVRQQYPWRELAISAEKNFSLPLWNPYNFAGSPLLENFQSAVFYPLNILFFFVSFNIAWSSLIFSEIILGGLFLYLYLDNLKLSKTASVLGAVSFCLSGFFTAWLEWGTILHTALWLPLILLSIDKLIDVKNKKIILWSLIFVFSLTSSLFAGHLQTFFYLFLLSAAYFLARWIQFGRKKKQLLIFAVCSLIFVIITAIQWIPTLQFILLSARNVDQTGFQSLGWFIPWQNLVQFLAPDFFGNPTTLNYFGVWNYGEFIEYVGIIPIIFSSFALFFRRDKKTLFFGSVFFLSLIFALPTIFAKIPFILNIPFLDSAQPTRLLFLTDFSLSVLAAFGFDYFLRTTKGIFYSLSFFIITFASLWGIVLFNHSANMLVSKHNLIFPTAIFLISVACLGFYAVYKRINKNSNLLKLFPFVILVITVFDLLRFGLKFNPFVVKDYVFPSTQAISFLQKNLGNFRYMTTDSRIMPPNFSTFYRLQSVDGYDPLYLLRYGELIAASERGKPSINPPFGFNRIITPHNYGSPLINLFGVKYVLSLSDINSVGLVKVFQEGQTQIYENKNVFSRAFFVKKIIASNTKQEEMNILFNNINSLHDVAVVEQGESSNFEVGSVTIAKYEENRVNIETQNQGEGFLVLTDTYYPTWKVKIDGKESKIYVTDFNFRGIMVPKGNHKIEFYDNLF